MPPFQPAPMPAEMMAAPTVVTTPCSEAAVPATWPTFSMAMAEKFEVASDISPMVRACNIMKLGIVSRPPRHHARWMPLMTMKAVRALCEIRFRPSRSTSEALSIEPTPMVAAQAAKTPVMICGLPKTSLKICGISET